MELKELLKNVLKPELILEVEKILAESSNLKELQIKLYHKLKDKVKPTSEAITIARQTLEHIQKEYIKNETPIHLIPKNLKLNKSYKIQGKWSYIIELLGIVKFIKILPLVQEFVYTDKANNQRIKYLIPSSILQDRNKKQPKEKPTAKDKIKSILF